MALQNRYQEFHDAIKLTRESEQYKKAKEKDDLITPKVETAFKDNGYTVKPNILQGSMATATGIIPLDGDYDIDRGLVIDSDGAPSDPLEPKKIIKDVLKDHGFSDPRIKKPCVTADYKKDPMHIDYPTYKLTGTAYELAVGKEHAKQENKKWDHSDPKGLISWITSSSNHRTGVSLTQDQKQQFYRLVRYVKRWRDFKYEAESSRKKVFSIALTVMLKEAFDPVENDDNEALLNALNVILDQKTYFIHTGSDTYSIAVELPTAPYRDIFDGKGDQVGTTLRNRLIRLRKALKDASGMGTEKQQCKKLREQFGDDFPEGKDEDRVKKESSGSVGFSGGA